MPDSALKYALIVAALQMASDPISRWIDRPAFCFDELVHTTTFAAWQAYAIFPR
jgi:hypothetical protein